ncbi:MAG: PHP domain-containing protein [Rhodothermales bacterium]
MDVRRADLHTHTVRSDGKLLPEELVKKVHAAGLRALAITDHDAVDALEEARPVADRLGVELITGVELSVTVGDEEIHLLGYGFDPRHAGLRAHLETFRQRRMERAEAIVARLRELGLPVRMDAVLERAAGGVVGRPHVAQALVDAGLVPSYDSAFANYLRDDGPAFVSKPRFPAREAVALLHDAGGVAVLAHPGTRVDGFTIEKLVAVGMDGIETVHPSHSPALTRRYGDLARKSGLIQTGGSDYHGFRPGEDENLFTYSIPYRRLEQIRRAAA